MNQEPIAMIWEKTSTNWHLTSMILWTATKNMTLSRRNPTTTSIIMTPMAIIWNPGLTETRTCTSLQGKEGTTVETNTTIRMNYRHQRKHMSSRTMILIIRMMKNMEIVGNSLLIIIKIKGLTQLGISTIEWTTQTPTIETNSKTSMKKRNLILIGENPLKMMWIFTLLVLMTNL